MLSSILLLVITVFVATCSALPATAVAPAEAARYELSQFMGTDGSNGWLLKSLNATVHMQIGAVLQVSQHTTGISSNSLIRWTFETSGNTDAKDALLTQRIQAAHKSISQARPPPQNASQSSAATQAASADRGDAVLQIGSEIGQRIGGNVGPPIGAVIGIFIGTEIGSIVGGPIGQYIGRLVGSGINYAFGPSRSRLRASFSVLEATGDKDQE